MGEGAYLGGEGCLVDREDAQTIGLAIWRVRDARGKSLRVVAGLAGMSKDTLQRIETGERSPTLAEIVALATALDIAGGELMKLPVPAPANGETDSAIEAVRLALMAVNHRQPGGQVLPVKVLRARVMAMLDARCRLNRNAATGAVLPELIRDLHTSLAAGRNVAELLDLAVLLHTQGTGTWPKVVGAPLVIGTDLTNLAHP